MIVVRVPTASDDQFAKLIKQLLDGGSTVEVGIDILSEDEAVITTDAPAATVADLCRRLGIGMFSTAPIPDEI